MAMTNHTAVACLTQLKDWHALFESCGINEKEYEEQKAKILDDLKNLK